MGELKLINIDKETNYDEWLSFRQTGLGASDVGTLMGLNPYKSKIELFYQKLGLIPIKQDENIPMFYGNRLEEFVANMWEYYDGEDPESVIRNYAAGTKVRMCKAINGYITNSDYPHLFLSPDRVMVDKESDKMVYGGKLISKNFKGVLEVKTINGFASKQWEGGIPPSYVTQLQTYLFGLEVEYGEIVFLEDGRKLWTIPMELNLNLKDKIVSEMNEFMDRIDAAKKDIENVQMYEPEPDGTEAFEKFLTSKYANSEAKTLQGSDEMFAVAVRHKVLAGEIKDIESQHRQCSNLLKNHMKEFEAIDFGEEKGKISWRTDSRGVRSLRNNVKILTHEIENSNLR
jgi:putative phage-type endonuclease